jgi:DNA-binding MarR family transcriptional regulator
MTRSIDLGGIDDAIHSPVRLAIMALLVSGDQLEFTLLRERLALTDGNLATHLRKLEERGYVQCSKSFIGRRPRTAYRILPRGRTAFDQHVAALEHVVSGGVARPPVGRKPGSTKTKGATDGSSRS